jgi:endoglucanase
MQVFDKTVEALTRAGVMVILNNHISDAMWCCNLDDGNGLWYNPRYSTKDFYDTLVKMTERYYTDNEHTAKNSMVIGVDIRNEIRDDNNNGQKANWGNGDENDWHLVATTAGNLILKTNPDQLIIIEGLNYALDMDFIRSMPIQLEITNKLVYSFHLYSFSCFDYNGYDDFKDKMT